MIIPVVDRVLRTVLSFGLLYALVATGHADEFAEMSGGDDPCARIADVVARALGEIEADCQAAAYLVRSTQPEGEGARQLVVDALPGRFMDTGETLLIDALGTVIAAGPSETSRRVGASIHELVAWNDLITTRRPVVTSLTGKGGVSIGLLWPVLDEENLFVAAIGLTVGWDDILRLMVPGDWHLPADSAVGFMTVNGAPLGGFVAEEFHADGSMVTDLRTRILAEEQGRGYVTRLDDETGDLSRRRVDWHRVESEHFQMIVTYGETVPWAPSDKDQLTGRWIGAYTEKEAAADVAEATDEVRLPRGGQMSVAILCDGSAVTMLGAGHNWNMTLQGVMAGSRLVAASVDRTETGSRTVWYASCTYDAEEDVIRGTLSGDAASRIVERTFFLRPSAPDDATE